MPACCWQPLGWICGWNKEENKIKYNTLRIIRRLLKNELEGMELEVTALNKELKKADPDGQLPESDPKVKMRKAANDWRYELECALKDFDAQDWQ